MMSKQCAQVVHDSGGVYGLTQRAQKKKDREVERQKEALVKKSKQIHSLQISASNYKISKEKWKQAFVAQREKGQAQLVEATARLRTKYAARIAQYNTKCASRIAHNKTKYAARTAQYKALLRGSQRVQSRGLWDARTPLINSIPYSIRKQIAIEHVNNRISMNGNFTNLSTNYGSNLLTNFGNSANQTPGYLKQVCCYRQLAL